MTRRHERLQPRSGAHPASRSPAKATSPSSPLDTPTSLARRLQRSGKYGPCPGNMTRCPGPPRAAATAAQRASPADGAPPTASTPTGPLSLGHGSTPYPARLGASNPVLGVPSKRSTHRRAHREGQSGDNPASFPRALDKARPAPVDLTPGPQKSSSIACYACDLPGHFDHA
jgi:hypothetical protein